MELQRGMRYLLHPENNHWHASGKQPKQHTTQFYLMYLICLISSYQLVSTENYGTISS